MDPVAAKKDLELLLENLLLNVWPLTREIQITVEPGISVAESLVHILSWSRKLVKALDIAIGRTGTLDSLQPLARQHEADDTEKLFHWSTRYFNGVVYGLPNIFFEDFLSIVA